MLLSPGVTHAQSIAEIASLPIATINHSATLLADGKVIVVGPTGRSDLFDPALNTWTQTALMLQGSQRHTATRLANGKVLVVGGYFLSAIPDSTGAYAVSGTASRAELFDPTTAQWSAAGSLSLPRTQHTLTLLPDGSAVAIGGSTDAANEATTVSNLIEKFSPTTGSWTSVGALPEARRMHTATMLLNGKLLILGGRNSANADATTCWLVDVTNFTSTSCAPLPVARAGHAAALLSNGKVYVAGGVASNTAFASIYDPANNTWTNTSQRETAGITNLVLIERNANSVLVAGGGGEFGYSLSGQPPEIPFIGRLVRDFFSSNGVSDVGTIGAAAPTMTQLADGRVLVVGGYGGFNRYCSAGCFFRPDATAKAFVVDRADVVLRLGIFGGGVAAFPEVGERVFLPLSVETATATPSRTGNVQIQTGTESCSVGPSDAGCRIEVSVAGSKTYSLSYAGDAEYKPAQVSYSMPTEAKIFIEGVGDFNPNKTVAFDAGGVFGVGRCGVNIAAFPAQCQIIPTSGTTVNLDAAAGQGWAFVGWQGACAGSAQRCTVTSPTQGAMVVRSIFAPSAALPLKLDIDANGVVNAATDGQLIRRFMNRIHDSALTQSALGANSQRTSPDEIENRLNTMTPLLDVDQNGRADANTDGLIILRFLLGFRGDQLTQNAIGSGARRTDPLAIATHLQALMP